MIKAVSVFRPEITIDNASVLAVLWSEGDTLSYYAIPASDIDRQSQAWLNQGAKDVVRIDYSTISPNLWIGICEETAHGIAAWGRARITVI